MLVAAGCGGGGDKKDASRDTRPPDASMGGGMDTLSAAALRVTPLMNDFGSVELGKMSAMPVAFTVSNTGQQAASSVNVAVTGDFIATMNGCTGNLAGGAMCMVQVSFRPTMAGPRSGQLTVTGAGDLSASASLTGTGTEPGRLAFNPGTQNFGTVLVGATSAATTFTLRNPGGNALTGLTVTVNGADFKLGMNTCMGMLAANATCTVQVTFQPGTSGAKTGSLVAVAGGQEATAALNGVGQDPAKLAAQPTMHNFGSTALGETSGTVRINVANAGEATSGAPTASVMGEFAIVNNACVAPLPGLGTCAIDVAFKPAAAGMEGMRMGNLTVSAMPGGMVTVALSGTAVRPGTISINPTTHAFPATTVMTSSTSTTFTVTNGGASAATDLRAQVLGAGAANFLIANNGCTGNLAAGASCAIQVQFSPQSAAAHSASLQVTATVGGITTAQLNGVGVPKPGLSVSPASNNFGTLALNLKSDAVVFTVTNTGGSATGTLTTAITGPAASQFEKAADNCSASLAAGASCQVSIRFAPTNAMPSDKEATLTVTGGPGESATASLSGAAVTPGTLQLNPTSVGFGDVVTGYSSDQRTITITNTGMTTSGMIGVTLAGADSGQYEIVTNGCAILAPGVTCQVVLRFNPTTVGAKIGSVIFMAMGAISSATLSGTGKAHVEPAVPSLDFGSLSAGLNGTALPNLQTTQVTIRVPGTGAAGAITTGASEFDIPTNLYGCSQPLGAIVATSSGTWSTCSIDLRFTPKNPVGAKTGALTVTAGTSTGTVALTGTATGPLSANPTTLAFGNQLVNASNSLTVTFTNNGTADITGVTSTLAAGGEFLVTADNCLSQGTLKASGVVAGPLDDNCFVTVRFLPTSAGAQATTLTVTGTLGSAMETVVVSITGTGATTGVGIAVAGTTAFGSVPIQPTSPSTQTFTVSNPPTAMTTGNLSITASINPADFKITTNNCVGGSLALPPGGSCTFIVSFDPSLNPAGLREGEITVADTTGPGGTVKLAVSGTATQPLSLAGQGAGDTGTYASTAVNDPAGPIHTFVITNASDTMYVTNTSVVPGTGTNPQHTHYIVASSCGTIAAGGTCIVAVRYQPGALGASSALLQVTSGAHVLVTRALSGTGVPDVDLSFVGIAGGGETRTFGEIRVPPATAGASATLTFTVKNEGGVPSGAVSITGLTAGFLTGSRFAIGGTCISNPGLAPDATCTVTVQHQPDDAGDDDSENLIVTAPGRTATMSTQTIALVSDAVASSSTYIVTEMPTTGGAPPPYDLGAAETGETGMSVALRFVNGTAGSVTLTGSPFNASNAAFEVVGAGSNPCAAAMAINAGGSCTFLVTFKPTVGAGTTINGTVTIAATGGNSADAGVAGRVKSNAILTVTAPSNGSDFGMVVANLESETRTWVVTNTGEKVSGGVTATKNAGVGDPTDFQLVSTTCTGGTLAPSATCNVVVRFTPKNPVGAKSSQFDVTDGTVSASFTATGTSVNPADLLLQDTGNAALAAHNFGTQPITSTNTTVTVRVRNWTNVNTQKVTGLNYSLSNSTDFKVEGCTAELTAGLDGNASCDLTVTFKPETVGNKTSILTVSGSPGGTETVTLTGVASPSLVLAAAVSANFTAGQERVFNVTLAASAATSSGPLTPSLTGTNAADFAFVANNCSGVSLAAAGPTTTCAVTVKFVGSGAKTATLTISSTNAGNSASLTLTGS